MGRLGDYGQSSDQDEDKHITGFEGSIPENPDVREPWWINKRI